jgi:putative transposase
MNFKPDKIYHLYNRTFNHTLAFPTRSNYRFFLRKLAQLRRSCSILCYCIMPDHFELILYMPEGSPGLRLTSKGQMQSFSRQIGSLLGSYAQAFNKQQGRRGSLFQPKTKAKVLDGDSIDHIERIHKKPVRAGLVFDANQWEFSSQAEYTTDVPGICHKTLAKEKLRLSIG